MEFSVQQVFAHDREPQTEEYCFGIRLDLSTEMKSHIPATATMTCLETEECAALARIGIPVYQIVKVNLFLRDIYNLVIFVCTVSVYTIDTTFSLP